MPITYPQGNTLGGLLQFDPMDLVGGVGMVKPALSPAALQRLNNLGPVTRSRLDHLLMDLGDITQRWTNWGAQKRILDKDWFTRKESVDMLMEQENVLKQLRQYPDFQNEPPIRLDSILDLLAEQSKKK